jgi:hypothetical protein
VTVGWPACLVCFALGRSRPATWLAATAWSPDEFPYVAPWRFIAVCDQHGGMSVRSRDRGRCGDDAG